MNLVLIIKKPCHIIHKIMGRRANRVLLDKARSILNDSELLPEFWAEAIAVACHILNLTLRKGKVKTFELGNIFLRPLEHLRVFGCVTFFYVPK